MAKKIGLIFAFIVLASLFPAGARADTGPKPTMEFNFIQETGVEALPILSGTLYQCEQPDCSDAQPLQQLGPQHFDCAADTCSSMSYGYSKYNRLEIVFSDGVTRQSNIFAYISFNASYSVTVRQSDLKVSETFTPKNILTSTYFWIALAALCCCVVVIIIVVVVILLARRNKRKPA